MSTTPFQRKPKPANPLETEDGALDWLSAQFDRAQIESFCEPVEITPALAEVMMRLNPDNRALKQVRLSTLEADMRNGQFVYNGESIILSKDGTLNDGQHRLQACINTGVTIKSVVCFGMDRDSRLTVDTGTQRTVADFLKMKGVEAGRQGAIVARLLWQYEKFGTVTDNVGGQGHGARMSPTKIQTQEQFYAKRDEIEHSLSLIPRKNSMVFGSVGLLAFLHILFARRERTKAREFMEMLTTGAGMPEGHPILVCRNRFLFDKKSVRTTTTKCELIIRAWNMWREGITKVKQIPIMERLPEIKK